ncbi:uncharacterized protein [Amphiura filiformis]|uniref:uncharacterized protein isoform X1 n=1 Tax=Amphiura filiformis TaxID=82378 RepID=UPI003B22433C
MRYIESAELREWVKENLRKTIFQKAHALAVQTGCEVLVKLHDSTDIENCQFYGTRYLKRIYQSSKLRQPGETLVSGETGLPLRDKSTQSLDVDDRAGGFDDAAEEMELNSTDTQTQVENQFDSPSLDSDTNSQVQVKTEPDDIEHQEHVTTLDPSLIDPSLTVNTEKGSELECPTSTSTGPGTSSPIISRIQPVMFTSVQRHAVPISPKPYQCSVCQKTFRSVQILQKHTLTFHSRPKIKSAMSLSRGRGKGRGGKGHGSQYFRHQQSQEDLEPRGYHCVMCNQSFHTQDVLHDHVLRVHSNTAVPGLNTTSQEQSNNQSIDPTQALSAMHTSRLEDESIPGGSTSFPDPEGQAGVGSMLMEGSPSFDMSHGSQSAFNLSTASTSSSMAMAQSTPGRRGPKIGDTNRTWKWRHHHTMVKTNTVNQFIMQAILLTPGPVSTRTAVNTAGPRFLRGSISNQQFQHACFALQNANLGYIASTEKSTGTPGTKAFIKKQPQAALEHIIIQGLCTADEYNNRYITKAPKCISQKLCVELIAGGHVTSDQFKERDDLKQVHFQGR